MTAGRSSRSEQGHSTAGCTDVAGAVQLFYRAVGVQLLGKTLWLVLQFGINASVCCMCQRAVELGSSGHRQHCRSCAGRSCNCVVPAGADVCDVAI
jgi:hypothetical protein